MADDVIIKLIVPALSVLFGMGTFYGIVRADFRHMVNTIGRLDRDIDHVRNNAEKAHERIDSHITTYHKG